MRVFFLILTSVLSITVFGQIRLDTTYAYKDLNTLLSNARKGKPSEDQEDLARIYYLLGKYEDENLHNSGQAFEYFTRSKEYFNLIGDTSMIHLLDLEIAERYVSAGLYQESIDLYEKALTFYQKQKNQAVITSIYNNLSKVYSEKGDNEKGLQFLNQAINLNQHVKDSVIMVEFLLNKIQTYQNLNEQDSALITAFDAFEVSKKLNDREKLAITLYQIGAINKTKSDYQKAIKYLLKAETFAPNTPFSEIRKKIYLLLAQCYATQNEYEAAYTYNQKYSTLNNKILSKERAEMINNLKIKYESEEKNTKMKLLEIDKTTAIERNRRQRSAMYLLTGGMILLLAFLYYIINFYRQKIDSEEIINTQKEEINIRKIQELQNSIQINSMKSMLEGQETERERIAKDLHDSLGGLLSTIKLQFDSIRTKVKSIGQVKEYNAATKMLDTAVDEVRSISQNLQPGALTKLGLVPALRDLFNRFDDEIYPDIDFQHYEVPEKLETMTSLSIYRIIQELLHNSIKHANANEILIQINKEEDELVIQYEDDGKGFDLEKLERRGMGLENILSRVNYLKGEINFDAKPGDGMSVLIQHVKI